MASFISGAQPQVGCVAAARSLLRWNVQASASKGIAPTARQRCSLLVTSSHHRAISARTHASSHYNNNNGGGGYGNFLSSASWTRSFSSVPPVSQGERRWKTTAKAVVSPSPSTTRQRDPDAANAEDDDEDDDDDDAALLKAGNWGEKGKDPGTARKQREAEEHRAACLEGTAKRVAKLKGQKVGGLCTVDRASHATLSQLLLLSDAHTPKPKFFST
jgi:hypothetical protein